MRFVEYPDGIAICGQFPDDEVMETVKQYGPFPLCVTDPPYGNIVGKKHYWDRVETTDIVFAQLMVQWAQAISSTLLPGGAAYIWGGTGTPQFRPFYRFLIDVEHQTDLRLSSHITWKKKRAYGIQWGYLFTREEVAYLVKGDIKKPRQFTVPLLSTKRGYSGYDPEHPALSEYYRRTNVWDDITEIFRGKRHVNEKPEALMEIPILAHTKPGEYVFDPFGGSGTTASAARKHGRKFVIIERDPVEFDKMCERLR